MKNAFKNTLLGAAAVACLLTHTPTGFAQKAEHPRTMTAALKYTPEGVGAVKPALGFLGIPLGITAANRQIIQSIQYGSVTFAGATTADYTLPQAVTVANTALVWLGLTISADGAQIQNITPQITITSTTNVRATRTGTGTACTVYFCALEFKSSALQSSVQYGSATIAAGTATISSVTVANAVCFFNGYQRGGTGSGTSSQFGAAQLTGATTVTVYSGVSDNSATSFFCVVEFKAGVLGQTAQIFSIGLTSVNSNTATIASAALANSMVIYGGLSTAATADTPGHIVKIVHTNATTLTGTRLSTDANVSTVYGTVITFAVGIIKQKQSNTISLSTVQTSNTFTLTAVVVAKTLLCYLGNSSADTVNDKRKQMAGITLTSTTVVTANLNTAPAINSCIVSFDAGEFY